jgi:hypothetical protein
VLDIGLDLHKALGGHEVAVRADVQLGERLALRAVAFLHECTAHVRMLPRRAAA